MFPRFRVRTKSKDAPVQAMDDKVYLSVTVNLARKDRRQFEIYADNLLSRFANAGLRMTIGSWREEGDLIRLFNLWSMDHAHAIISSELELVDDPEYLLLDQLLFGEVKNVVFRVSDNTLTGPDKNDPEQYCYVRVINEIETPQLAEFRARHDASAYEFRRATGWGMGDAFIGVTGNDTIMQIWRVPVRERASIGDYLIRTPWDDLLERPPQFEVFHPSPFDTLMPRFVDSKRLGVELPSSQQAL